MQITSLQHPFVRHALSLRKEKGYREEKKRLLLIGQTLISEYKKTLHTVISVHPSPFKAEKSYLATPEILYKITNLNDPDIVAAEIDLPLPQELTNERYVLILDRIQDPGNAGTLLRSAWALNWEAVIVTPNTVDLFNDKALRASQGASLFIPFSIKTQDEIIEWASKYGHTLLVADAKGKPLSSSFPPPLALILSHEGQGAHVWKNSQSIAIPLGNQMDSLNVAAAGSILLYALRGLS